MTGAPAPRVSDAPQGTGIASLLRRLEFQRLLSEVSTQFINLPTEQIDAHINQALGRVATFLGFNLAALAKFSGQGGAGEVTHIWTAEGLPPIPPGFTESDFPWMAERLTQGHTVHLSSLDEFPPQAERDRQTYERLGIRTAYNWPLNVGQAAVGCLCIASVASAHSFPAEFDQGLRLLAQVMASTLARVRNDQALRESEERLSLAADAAAAGLWSLNLATGCFWLTKKTRELFDFATDEVVTFERFLSLVHPDDQELMRQTVQTLVQSKNKGQVEYRIIRPDGSVRWMLSRGCVQCNMSGVSDYLTGVSMDITPRKQAEGALRESDVRLASAVEAAALGLYEMGSDPKQIFLDERLRSLLGLPPEEAHRAHEFWAERIHPDDRERLRELSRKVLNGELDGATVEYRYLHPLRGLLWFSHVSRALERDAAGRAVRRLGVIRDITEQRGAERDAEELRNSLAHAGRVTLLGQLASALAHELSQPLGAILRNAEAAELMLQQPSPDLEELRAIVADIRADDQRAAHVIDRLRSLLKRRRVHLQPIELQGLITGVLSLVRTDAAARRVKLGCSVAPGLPEVRGDRIHLQQVLLNLLLNAMDALAGVASHERSIQISACRADPGMVEVRVCDNGPGIPGVSPERLFEPFFTTKANGLGLGLPVSKTIIEAHQGKIWAENQPEGGACFSFTLPVAEVGKELGDGSSVVGKE